MSPSRARVGVVGATGYSGAIAARLVASHPALALAFATSDALAGESIGARLGVAHAGKFVPNGEALAHAAEVDAVILATPADASARLAPAMVEAGKVVVDLSGAFRLADAAAYAKWYGFAHPRPDLLARAHYGLPELFGAPIRAPHALGGGALVANPGCYPTATLLAIAPLVRAKLVEARGIVVDAKSGVTGAGRQAKEAYSFSEVDEDVRPYKLLEHQHTPEIVRGIARASHLGDDAVTLTFTPHLVPLRRGLLATCYARPRPGVTQAQLADCLAETYRASAFVDVAPADHVAIARVAGTNRARVGVTSNADVVIAVGAIDNLLKGASGQAIQNLNLLLGLDESAGLAHLQPTHP